VALGYWNDPAKTAERFKPAPGQPGELTITEMAVWSGDTVRKDKDGFLYFIGRKDEMIKTSGYRVSPTEVEEVAYASGIVGDAVAVAASHADLGQAIVLVVSAPSPAAAGQDRSEALLAFMKSRLPNFMVPHHVAWLPELPRNPNGKFDRPALAAQFKTVFVPQ
jgi:acyl-coenzyme A synthetase/AMP-(fatty) acid ligase